jgi:hypothetical protein
MPAKIIFVITFIFLASAFAQNKARVINPDTDVFSDADFNSNILGTVDPDETFLVSKKKYGEAFYKVKFKDGTIGYIPDSEVNIEGIGTVKPRPFRGEEPLDQKALEKLRQEEKLDPDEDTENPKIAYKGALFSVINFREETLGATQVSDLSAFGFRYQPMEGNFQSGIAYDLIVAPKAPTYYADKTGGDTSGAVFWGAAGISNISAINTNTSLRYGAGPFLRYSYFTVKNPTLQPNRTYNLQDLTAGIDFQAGVMLHSRYMTIDLGLRYFWDKESYGGFGIGFLF